ncbi:acyl-CoA thioesterase domain-containing protein [Nocardioides sp. InS609-2]|uniref:acyl-CoA thioesterase domain-containing protein n=1 Tax=Nocardioides sp. InS609-2 TaxID=2760705 RepID=UPI0024A72C93|nr:acyl-CoA thioesterase domain-containing protein [Nocardioides sp. InS609-2]
MTIEWDEHIAVRPRGDGVYDAELTDGWVVGGGVNGGYLLATIGNAISHELPDKPDPIAVSAYYLSATTPGPAQVQTRVLRTGGSVATVGADLVQGDVARITALATTAVSATCPTMCVRRRRSRSCPRVTSACPTRWRLLRSARH